VNWKPYRNSTFDDEARFGEANVASGMPVADVPA